MQTLVRLQPKGLITIPKKIRDAAGFVENSHLNISFQNGKVTLEPIRSYSYPIRSYTDEEIAQFLKDDKLDPKLARKLTQKFGFKPFPG